MPVRKGPDGKFLARDAEHKDNDSEEISILKRTIRDLRYKNRGLQTGESLITEAVKQAYDDPPELWIPKAPKQRKKKHEEIAVLHLSDVHLGKITRSYDSSVAETRLLKLAQKVIDITQVRRSTANIREIRVYMGGDMIEGEEIFSHQAHLIDQSLFEQAVKTAPAALTRTILCLLREFEKVRVVTVPGNHGRNGPRGGRAHPKTNWDNVCYEVLKIALLGPDGDRKELKNRLEMNVSEEFYAVDEVYDWGNLMVHGHEIRGGFAGFPWYGVSKRAWGWIDAIPAPWDYLWFGHFHTYASFTLNERQCLANGSLESDNDYAQANLSACGHPCQRLCFFSEQHGIISENQVYLTDITERMPHKLKGRMWAR